MSNTPETVEDALQRGMQRARQYDWPAAVEAYRKAVALDPENVEARFRLGWALWNLRGSFGCIDSNRSDVRYEMVGGHRLDRAMLELLKSNGSLS